MTGNDISAALTLVLGYGQVEELVQSIDRTLEGASAFGVDTRISVDRENVTGADHIGVTEIDDGVTIRMRRRNVNQFNPLTVKESIPLVFRRVVRPAGLHLGRCFGFRHPIENGFVRPYL